MEGEKDKFWVGKVKGRQEADENAKIGHGRKKGLDVTSGLGIQNSGKKKIF